MTASPTPIRLKDALQTGDKTTRFCVYRYVDGNSSCQTVPAKQAEEMLESGDYFQCPTKAKEAALERIIKNIPEDAEDKEEDPEFMDKRTKEYKDWKASQEEGEA